MLWTCEACEGMCSLLLQVRRSWSTLTMPSSLWGPQYSARISPAHRARALKQATAKHSEHAHLPSSLWGPQYSARISPEHTAGTLMQAAAQHAEHAHLPTSMNLPAKSGATLGKAVAFASADSCMRNACSRAQGHATSSHV